MVRRSANALRSWLDVRDLPGRSVFGLKASGVYQVLERTARRGGVRGRWNPHAFRHGFARGLLDNGADLATVSQLMGHSDVSITVRFYARWSDEELHRKHARFTWLPDS
jgi:site-specific recombinase XerD